MSKIFDEDSESDVEIKTDNEYAKNYDTWRKKEELNKLKTKFGEDALLGSDEESSSSSDDEEAKELTQEIEKQFFKTLACLKNKDPKIYDKNIKFFDEKPSETSKTKEKNKKEQPIFIKDYERKLLLEKGGQISDSDDEQDAPSRSPTYVEEQEKLREDLKKASGNISDDDEELLTARKKTKEEEEKEEENHKAWLAGRKRHLKDKETERDLKPLEEFWNNPHLDDDEKFLRDYILDKKYLGSEDPDHIPTYNEIIHDSDEGLSEDEKTIEKQEEFEHKYNFRFEEPDQEFIKRYPRTIENSLRKTDDRRKIKRVEVKERKEKEKVQKREELRKLQELKRKEIEEKIEKLKEITGNDDIGFQEEDLEADFDPEAHDRRMRSIFNDDYYEGPEEELKPKCPEIDEELEIENWDEYTGEDNKEDLKEEISEVDCEDEQFNMDCDYDPRTVQRELIENSRGKKKRKRKSKFAKMIAQKKPVFDPNDKSFEQYMDEYYKFDCEDIIGDIPCRFKYREVVPNSFGLSIAEILSAKDRELNRWCSLKKAVQIRPEQVEKYDLTVYERKGQNEALKKKIFPSLYSVEQEDDGIDKEIGNAIGKIGENRYKVDSTKGDQPSTKSSKKKSKKRKNGSVEGEGSAVHSFSENTVSENQVNKKLVSESEPKKKKRVKTETSTETVVNTIGGKKRKFEGGLEGGKPKKTKKSKGFVAPKEPKSNIEKISDSRLSAYGIKAKKFKNRLKYGNRQ